MTKYKVVVSERYFVYKTVIVETDAEAEADELAFDKAEEIDIELGDLEYSDAEIVEFREIKDGHQENS